MSAVIGVLDEYKNLTRTQCVVQLKRLGQAERIELKTMAARRRASLHAIAVSRFCERRARESIDSGLETDAEENDRFGDRRGDEVATSPGRRQWFREARR